MKRSLLIGSLFVWVTACGHTKEVETASESSEQAKPAKPAASARSKPAPRASDDIPLASDPMGMLTPKGQEQLREQLKRRDLLKNEGGVPAALRKFQASEGIPETGMPDDETLKRLGLDPDDVVVRVRPPT